VSVDDAVAFFRQEQADIFRSTCTIKFQSGETFIPATGSYTPTYTNRATGVSCLIRPRSGAQAETGEEEAVIGTHEGKFPVNQNVQIGDLVDVTASTHDAALIGKTFAVRERLYDSWQISRRVLLEVVEG
jgi:hypothetical protein